MSRLDPDHLGAKGEALFQLLCEDAQLICNQSIRDRMGWDFIVEFNTPSQKDTSLDRREGVQSCLIQVKSIYDTSTHIKLRLNMAENIAKAPKPSFIFVLKSNESNEFSTGYLIHISDDRLSAILKRLRKEESNGTRPEEINNKYISFTPKKDEEIILSGSALRGALSRHIGNDIFKYCSNKEKLLRKLGYEYDSFVIRMDLGADSNSIENLFTGANEFKMPEIIKHTETRFGITLPQKIEKIKSIRIEPNLDSKCELYVKNSRGERKSRTTCTVARIPRPTDNGVYILIFNEILKIRIIKSHQEFDVSFNIQFDKPANISCWYESILPALTLHSTTSDFVEIKFIGQSIRLDNKQIKSKKSEDIEILKTIKETIEPFLDIIKKYSDAEIIETTAEEIIKMKDDILSGCAIINGEDVSLSGTIQLTDAGKAVHKKSGEIIFIGQIKLQNICIAYAAASHFSIDEKSDTEGMFEMFGMSLISCEQLEGSNPQLDTFKNRILEDTLCKNYIIFTHESRKINIE